MLFNQIRVIWPENVLGSDLGRQEPVEAFTDSLVMSSLDAIEKTAYGIPSVVSVLTLGGVRGTGVSRTSRMVWLMRSSLQKHILSMDDTDRRSTKICFTPQKIY